VMLIANDLLYQQFLEHRYQQSTEVITLAGQELEQLREEARVEATEDQDESMLDSITRAWSNSVESIDLSGKLKRMQAQAAEIIEHLVQLSVVFILQTGLLPIAFLWVFLEVLKRIFKSVRVRNRQE